MQAPAAAGQERYGGPAAAVVAIQERYRGLEAAVAASGSVARPVTEAQGVAEAGSAAFAAICDVARAVAVAARAVTWSCSRIRDVAGARIGVAGARIGDDVPKFRGRVRKH